MKISIGMNLTTAPWGGGNQFGNVLKTYLEKSGCYVVTDLRPEDIDIILLTEPRSKLTSSAYNDRNIQKYQKKTNGRAIVVHRINECDERKGTNYVNQLIAQANKCADCTVFISEFLKKIYSTTSIDMTRARVILNGADTQIFYPATDQDCSQRSLPYKVVTHHWGANWSKGFEVYQLIDQLLSQAGWRKRIEFTYIGNLPERFHFKNANHIKPLAGIDLANELRKHDIYLTASQNEPAGMHHIEGACCGLPVLYLDSGAIPEYCGDHAICFGKENLEQKLHEVIDHYGFWVERIKSYPYTADKMCSEYYALFQELTLHREHVLARRSTEKSSGTLDRWVKEIRSLLH
tara:strand:- start:413 stop:1456 length:1044 start_codon:yes stop_codon:yes gene_type:complete